MVERRGPVDEETSYLILKHLAADSTISQRQLASALGVSVGKINYCLSALIEKGLLKIRNFRNSQNKLSYAYILTPRGIEEKVDVTHRFLRRKLAEYDSLSEEIARLSAELDEEKREQ